MSREIILEDSIEEKWEAMAAVIRENLYVDYFYMVNLTGGTKYMALAIYNVFLNFDSKFYYIPYPKNILLQTGTNESFILDTRVSVKDYLTMYGVNMSEKDLALDKSYTESKAKQKAWKILKDGSNSITDTLLSGRELELLSFGRQ